VTKQEQLLAFTKALEANRYDEATRKVFADFLEENGYDDEAVAQRKWTREWQESVDWITDFAAKLHPHWEPHYKADYDEDEPKGMSYEEFMKEAEKAGRAGDAIYFNFDTPNVCYEQADELMKHYRIVTGKDMATDEDGDPITDDNRIQFHCGC